MEEIVELYVQITGHKPNEDSIRHIRLLMEKFSKSELDPLWKVIFCIAFFDSEEKINFAKWEEISDNIFRESKLSLQDFKALAMSINEDRMELKNKIEDFSTKYESIQHRLSSMTYSYFASMVIICAMLTTFFFFLSSDFKNDGSIIATIQSNVRGIANLPPNDAHKSSKNIDDSAWEIVKNSNSPQVLEKFIRDFPQSPWLSVAELKLLEITTRKASTGQIQQNEANTKTGASNAAIPLPIGAKAGMIRINPGRFTMGDNEFSPPHNVVISTAYFLSDHEVTVNEFQTFVEETHYTTEAESKNGCLIWVGNEWKDSSQANWKNPGFKQTPNHPVVCVSWNDTQAYLQWLNKKSGLLYRLPTEAEWEFALRAGTQTLWPCGNEEKCLKDHAWYGEKMESPAAVKQKLANAWGLYDMSGNVWEWVQDWYQDYTPESLNDPQGALQGTSKVLRGGSWLLDDTYLRSAVRHLNSPNYRSSRLGFRVALK